MVRAFAHGAMGHRIDLLSYYSFHPVIHDWCNKGCGMYYPVCRMMHIKEPLLLIEKSSLCGSSGFPLSLSEWSLLRLHALGHLYALSHRQYSTYHGICYISRETLSGCSVTELHPTPQVISMSCVRCHPCICTHYI